MLTSHIKKYNVLILFYLLPIFLFTSCSSTEEPVPEPPAKELVKSSSQSVETSEAELFSEAKKFFSAELYTLAKEYFEKLRDSYPNGAYSEFAEIKIADCDLILRNYAAAASAFEKFASDHPSSASAPYALLEAGRTYQISAKGVGRDVSNVERAVEIYQDVLKLYPNTSFAQKAKVFLKESASVLADQDDYIAKFYEKKNLEVASESRKKDINKTYNQIVDSTKTIETDPVAIPVPFDQDYRRTEIKSSLKPNSNEANTYQEDDDQQDSKLPFVERIECTKLRKSTIFLYLNKDPQNEAELLKTSRFISSGRTLTFKLPGIRARGTTLDCFSSKDLSVEKDGTININDTRAASLMILTSPPRLLIEVVAK